MKTAAKRYARKRYEFVGFAPSFLFFLLVLSWSSIWLVTGKLERPGSILLRLCGLTLALAIWVNLRAEPGEVLPHAGALGAWIGGRMVSVLGYFLSVVIVAPVTFAALLLATDYFFIRYFESLGQRRTEAATATAPRGGQRCEAVRRRCRPCTLGPGG